MAGILAPLCVAGAFEAAVAARAFGGADYRKQRNENAARNVQGFREQEIALLARNAKSSCRCANAPVNIEDGPSFDALAQRSPLPVLVDFWAERCGPCKMIAPELEKVAARGAGQWIVAKVNTELLPEVAQRFRVSSIPLLVLFRGGQEIARQAGAMPAAGIEQFIQARV